MERAAPNMYREEGNCHFADDTQLKVTFKEKTSGFRYYICPLSCMWDWAHRPFSLAQGCRTRYTDRNCRIKNTERQPSSTSASNWSGCDCWSAISTFSEEALSQRRVLASSLPLKKAVTDNFILKNKKKPGPSDVQRNYGKKNYCSIFVLSCCIMLKAEALAIFPCVLAQVTECCKHDKAAQRWADLPWFFRAVTKVNHFCLAENSSLSLH